MTLLGQALQALERGKPADAEELCRRRLAQHRNDPDARGVLAVALAAQRRHDECIALLQELSSEQPNEAAHAVNLGNVLREAGRFDEAIRVLRDGLGRWPSDTRLQFNLALTLFGRGDWRESGAMFERLERDPGAPLAASVYRARCLAELGHGEQALALAQRVVGRARGNVSLINELALTFDHAGAEMEALRLLEEALALDPGMTEARANLADILERTNREQEAAAQVAAMGTAVERLPEARLVRARLWQRQGRTDEAIGDLQALVAAELPPRAAADAFFELGRLLDAAGRPEEAYCALERANSLVLRYWERQTGRSAADSTDLAWLRETFEADEVASWPGPADPGDARSAPIFVVGFPRSGSTLFGQMLDAHPALQTLEEKPAVEAMVRALHGSGKGYADALAGLSGPAIASLRDAYWAEVSRHLQARPDARVVDKYPLNMVRLALIRRVFPGAPFLLLLRHPCDVVFSCFMQNFRITDGTVGFHSLENTARVYARVMQKWVTEAGVFAPRCLEVRYEDLIADPAGELQRVVDFLEIAFDPRMLDPGAQARARGRIHTPSYSQVIRPLYSSAIGRWRRYGSRFEAVRPLLQPWIERFGYARE